MPDLSIWVLFGIAMLNAVTAVFAFMTHKAATATQIIAATTQRVVAETKADVATIEKATNSMKDAIVAVRDKAGRAEGELKGQAEPRAEIAKDPLKKGPE